MKMLKLLKFTLALAVLTACESEETMQLRQQAKHPVTHEDSLIAKGYKLGYNDGHAAGYASGQATGMVVGGSYK